jgi:hypothetical protein
MARQRMQIPFANTPPRWAQCREDESQRDESPSRFKTGPIRSPVVRSMNTRGCSLGRGAKGSVSASRWLMYVIRDTLDMTRQLEEAVHMLTCPFSGISSMVYCEVLCGGVGLKPSMQIQWSHEARPLQPPPVSC